MIRSTNKMTNTNSVLYMQRNFSNLSKVTSQIGAYQQVLEIDDNPLSANVGIKLTGVMAKIQQYNTSIKTTGIPNMKYTDGLLEAMKNQADKISKLVVGAANATATSITRAENAQEMNQILQSLVADGNQNDGTRFVFGGTQSTSAPFTTVGTYVNYTGNSDRINLLVDNGLNVPINMTGTDIFGNLETTISSKDMNPGVNLTTDHSSKLSDLNGGQGIPKGKVIISYSSYPNGLEVDLSKCDTLEDVKDAIEEATLSASRNLTSDAPWLDQKSLDWHDLQDRYVKVSLNAEGNGLSLQEIDLGEALPEASALEKRHGLSYSGTNGYQAGQYGVADDGSGKRAAGTVTVFDKPNTIYGTTGAYAPMHVDDFAGNKVATGLGIKGTANNNAADKILGGKLNGADLNPKLSSGTLLADLDGYNDSVYTFTNGSKDTSVVVQETSADVNNVFSAWNLTGVSIGENTGKNGELYVKAVNNGTPDKPNISLEFYTQPLDKARPSDKVATGTYSQSSSGGTVNLEPANGSGLSGTVGIVLSPSVGTANISLKVSTPDNFSASVHVPAFVEETENGISKDVLGIASGWNLTGLDKPPASGFDLNHVPSTDLDGDVSVNYRYDGQNNRFVVELSRPAYDNVPAALIATGSIALPQGFDPAQGLGGAVSGRVQFIAEPGFEGVGGSVYLELPAGTKFQDSENFGTDKDHPTSVTYALQGDLALNGKVTFGGATELKADLALGDPQFTLSQDTTFKKGQVFNSDILLPNGGRVAAGTPLDRDVTLPKGMTVSAGKINAGTVIMAGQELTAAGTLPKGTVIPRGSYKDGGFPAQNMGMSVTTPNPFDIGNPTVKSVNTTGYDVRATFATLEDFNRAVEEAGIYVRAGVSSDGKGIEFKSSLAGAYLTVSEDTDCYEQLGDVNQQLSGLNLSGLIKGKNADSQGNVYSEVIYYPPNPAAPDHKIHLEGANGQTYDLEPGYYVRVYSDPEQMKLPFEDRDNSKLVSEGFVANSGYDINGYMPGLVLEERNNSGVFGSVDFDYYNGKPQTGSQGEQLFYDNSDIVVYPGGMRNAGSTHTVMQEIDIYSPVPGQNCDYAGTFHGTITNGENGPQVTLYKDSSHKTVTAKSDPNAPVVDGKVVLYEVDKYGNIPTKAEDRKIAGTINVAANNLPAGASDSFSITPGANRNTGQKREDNIFATINDVMQALEHNDEEALHNILGRVQVDVQRTVDARALNGARQQRLEMLSERHADDLVRYDETRIKRVGMDDQALAEYAVRMQASTNAFQAAMQVSTQIMQLSILQYI